MNETEYWKYLGFPENLVYLNIKYENFDSIHIQNLINSPKGFQKLRILCIMGTNLTRFNETKVFNSFRTSYIIKKFVLLTDKDINSSEDFSIDLSSNNLTVLSCFESIKSLNMDEDLLVNFPKEYKYLEQKLANIFKFSRENQNNSIMVVSSDDSFKIEQIIIKNQDKNKRFS